MDLAALALIGQMCFPREPIAERLYNVALINDWFIPFYWSGLTDGKFAPQMCSTDVREILDESLRCSGIEYEIREDLLIIYGAPPCAKDCCPIRVPKAEWR